MQAVQIHTFGGTEVLKLESIPVPIPGEGEILVKVHAAGINPVDYKTRAGTGVPVKSFPAILGWDISGVVEAVGTNVQRFRIGDAVYGMPRFPALANAYAEYTTASAHDLALKPETLSHVEAAALPLAVLTAWHGLERMNLQAGQTLVVHAAAGGVGHLVVQLAKASNINLIGTASKTNESLVKDLGATFVDYTAQPLEQVIKDVDAVFDTVGGETLQRSFQLLKPGGILVTIADTPSEDLAKQYNVRAEKILVHPSGEQLETINKLIGTGKLKPFVGATFKLADVAKAHELSASRRARGKIVLEIA